MAWLLCILSANMEGWPCKAFKMPRKRTWGTASLLSFKYVETKSVNSGFRLWVSAKTIPFQLVHVVSSFPRTVPKRVEPVLVHIAVAVSTLSSPWNLALRGSLAMRRFFACCLLLRASAAGGCSGMLHRPAAGWLDCWKAFQDLFGCRCARQSSHETCHRVRLKEAPDEDHFRAEPWSESLFPNRKTWQCYSASPLFFWVLSSTYVPSKKDHRLPDILTEPQMNLRVSRQQAHSLAFTAHGLTGCVLSPRAPKRVNDWPAFLILTGTCFGAPCQISPPGTRSAPSRVLNEGCVQPAVFWYAMSP